MLNGRFDAAMASNILAVIFLPLCALAAARHSWHWLAGSSPKPIKLPAAVLWSVFFVIFAYTVARNLPWEPFNLLAPRSLGDSP